MKNFSEINRALVAKKKPTYLLTLLLTTLLLLPWNEVKGAQSLPYNYGFESDFDTEGWTMNNQKANNTSRIGVNATAKRTGNAGYRLSSYDAAANQYLISLELNAPTGVIVQFYYKASNSTVETFKVGYSTTGIDPDNFTWSNPISTSGTSWTQSEEFSFPAGTQYVSINYYSNTDRYYLYVDDFTFSAPPSCPKPSALTKTTASATSASFSWTAGKDETSWQYICLPAASALDWSDANVQTATSATATVSGLTAETDYKFYVRAYCSSSDQSTEVVKAFRTPCVGYATASLPFEENFNSVTANTIPSCWSKIAYVSGDYSYPFVYSGGVTGNCMYFYGGGETSASTIILPPFEAETNTLLLSFSYKNYSTSTSYGQAKIGYITDPEDVSTFKSLSNLARTTSWTEVKKFALTGAKPNSYIAIQLSGGASGYNSQRLYLDDIKVSLPSSCIDPTDVNAVAASANSATVSWIEAGSATAWNIQYSTDNFATSTTVSGVTTNPYTLTGLTEQTTYKVRVQADCGGEQSDWVVSSEFSTPCAGINGIGWSANFAGEAYGSGKRPSCWEKNSSGNYPYIYNYGARSNSRCLYFSGGTNTSEVYAILPPFNEATSSLYVTLYYNNAYDYGDYSADTYGQLAIGYMTNPADASTFVAKGTLARVNTYTQAKVALTGATPGSRVAIRFAGGSTSGYAFVDDIAITAVPSCLAPTDVEGVATAYNAASISWTENNSKSAWKIRYSSNNGENWSDEISVSTNPYSLTGLNGNSNYIVQVKTVCGGEDVSDWSASSASIPTPCGPTDASNYTMGFETSESVTAGAGNLPGCWEYNEPYMWSTTKYPYVYNGISNAYAGSQCLYFYGGITSSSQQTITLPAMDRDLSGLTLEFYHKNPASEFSVRPKFVVGYISSTGFEAIATLDYADTYTLFKKNLGDVTPAIPSANRTLAIRYTGGASGSSAYIDNIRVYPTPDCSEPTGITISNIGTTSAQVSWTENNGKSAWKIQLSNDGSSWGEEIAVNANPYSLSGLTPNHTTYYVRVKTVCGVSEESPWSETSAAFETECEKRSLGWSENFNSLTTNGEIPTCWDNSEGSTSTANYKWSYSASGHEGKCVRFESYYNGSNLTNTLKTPTITISEAAILEFWYKNPAGGDFSITYTIDGALQSDALAEDLTDQAEWKKMSILLPAKCIGKDVVIWFNGTSNNGYNDANLYLDDVQVIAKPACMTPDAANLVASAVTAHTATITWVAGDAETAWNLQYKEDGGSWSAAISVSTTPSHNLSGLSASTTYFVRVQANCGGEGNSEYTTEDAFSFTTECDPKSVTVLSPWTCGFEADEYAVNTVPSCWKEMPEGHDNYTYALISNANQQTGSQCLELEAYNKEVKIAILPTFSEEIKNLRIAFSYKNSGTSASNYGKLELGYVSGGIFIPVGDAYALSASYVDVSAVDMPTEAPDGAHIAFKLAGIKNYYTSVAYLDDITVSLKPSCEVPTGLTAVATSTGANVSWTDENASAWKLQYSIKDADSWTEVTGISATNYTLTGLSTAYEYEVQVKAVCGAGNESVWTASAEFQPVCNAPTALAVTARTQNSATFNWTSNESAWKLQYRAVTTPESAWSETNVTTKPFTLSGLGAGTTYQAKIQSACGSAFTSPVSFTTWCGVQDASELPIEITSFSAVPACWEATFKGDYSGVSNSKICFYGTEEQMLVLPAYDINLNQLSVTFTFTTSGATPEFGYIDEPNGAFHAFSSALTSGVESNLSAEAAAVKYIAMRYPGGSGNYSYVMISAVNIRRTPGCAQLDAPTATPSTTSAEISWTAGGESAWNMQYKLATASSWTNVTETVTNPFTLNGLTPGASYKVRVQADCGSETGDWSDETTFTTNCAAITAIPFVESFNASLSNCWTIYSENTEYYASQVYGGELRLPGGKNNAGHVVVLPEITASLANAALSLDYSASSNGETPEVGYVTDKADKETFVLLVALSKSENNAHVLLNTVPSGAYLALRYDGTGSTEGTFAVQEIRILAQLNLADNVDNSATLSAHNGQAVDVTIGRTFVCADYYNTICLPFSLSAAELAASPIATNDLWAFKYARVEGGELLIRIQETNHINAGEPYLIAWPAGENIANPLFKNVTITASAGKTLGEEDLKFVGILKPEVFAAHDDSKLFLYSENTLHWWNGTSDSKLNSFRAFFTVPSGSGSATIKRLPARLIKEDQVATDVDNVQSGAQTIKVLENNQVIIIRNGVKYTIQGQKIQ